MKKWTAGLLALLQAFMSFGPGASSALAQYSVRAQVQAPVVSVGVAPVPAGALAPLAAPTFSATPSLAAPHALPSLPVVSANGVVAAPAAAVQSRAASASAMAAPAGAAASLAPAALRPAAVHAAAVPAAVPSAAEAAPASFKNAERAMGAPEARRTALELPGRLAEMPADAAKGSAEAAFAAILGQRLIKASGEVSGPAVFAPGGEIRGRAANLAAPEAPRAAPKAEPAAPSAQAVPARASLWSRPAVRGAAVALGAALAAAAVPFLVPHAGIVAAVGSAVLTVIGLPQIYKNYKGGKEGVKDLVIASPLIWLAAATLLSVVSIGNGASVWWNLANVAGIAESAAVVGQINWYKRDKADLKATGAVAAASAAWTALVAAHPFMPLKAWLDLSFTGAMSLLWVLNAPQIRANYHLYHDQGRTPTGIAPMYPALVAGGSLLHLFTALVTGDLRWATNAVIGIVTTSIVLGQLYAPGFTNALVGPVVRLLEALFGLFKRPTPVARAFEGADLARFEGKDHAVQLAAMTERAKALPGRSAIYLEAPTAAGKSTLAKSLEAGLGARIRSLEVDRYFKNISDVPRDSNGQPDFDRPDAMLLDRVAADIRTLLAGGRIELPRHDMATGKTTFDSGEFMELGPDEVLIVDSIFASHPLLKAAAEGHQSLAVYLDAPSIVRLARRLARDKVARGKPVGDNLKGWARILENEARYIKPLKGASDMTLNLVGAEELAGLQAAYEKLLAAETDPAVAALMAEMIRASLAADR